MGVDLTKRVAPVLVGPQYLMPTRPTIFQTLGRSFPLYMAMYRLVTASNPVMFKLSSQSRSWLEGMKSTIQAASRGNYPCACDYPSQTYTPSGSQAPAICQQTCAAHGGWNGHGRIHTRPLLRANRSVAARPVQSSDRQGARRPHREESVLCPPEQVHDCLGGT